MKNASEKQTPQFDPFVGIRGMPADPIFGLPPGPCNLAVGIYQNGEGKVEYLPVVLKTEREQISAPGRTPKYLPIDGHQAYEKATMALVFGEDASCVKEGRVVTVQTLGGSGGLRVGFDLIVKNPQNFPVQTVWISDPCWENTSALAQNAGLKVEHYPYYYPATRGLNFDGLLKTLDAVPEHGVVLLHVCCHNPTGIDPTLQQWAAIRDVVVQRKLTPFFDFAYQGFADGLIEDRAPLRLFDEAGVSFLVSSSYSKNFALYNQRIGALSLVFSGAANVKDVLSNVRAWIRSNYSNPPEHGAELVFRILSDDKLRAEWSNDVTQMRERIKEMRRLFVQKIKALGVTEDLSHIEAQKGMFSYTGFSPEIIKGLYDRGIYLLATGRMCLAALNDGNLDTVCENVAELLKKKERSAFINRLRP